MQLISYIKYLLKSQNQHGLHSPFVYDLVTNSFYDKKSYEAYQLLKNYRNELLKNHKIIKVTDFGAGSRIFTSNERKISAIAKNVGIPEKRARFLFRLIHYLRCENILELGTSLGMGTAALAVHKNTRVVSIEGCPQTANVARNQLKKFGLNNVELKVGEFEEIISKIKKPSKENNSSRNFEPGNWDRIDKEIKNQKATSYDLIYFDGHHTQEATLNYFRQLLPTAHNDSVFVFDDIHWSKGMEAAWEEIQKHPKVKVTIDTFFLGLVFFRKEQAKQHFKIRL